MGNRAVWCAVLLTLALGCSSADAPGSSDAALDGGDAGPEGDADAGADPRSDAPFALHDVGSPAEQGLPCNGREAYCDRRYDELCQVATHDSAASSTTYWQAPTQSQTVLEQLNGGVRALMLDVQSYQGAASVCRQDCTQGNASLAVVLALVKQFFADNPREIVSLLVDTTLTARDLAAELTAAELDGLALARDPAAAWPTLRELIDSNHRLVVFARTAEASADAGAAPAWVLPRRDLLWETGADWASLAAMTCNVAAGDASLPLYLVHHNLRPPADGGAAVGAPEQALAAVANTFVAVTARLQACQAQHARAPTFVAVDFSSEGDVEGAAEVVNGVRAPP